MNADKAQNAQDLAAIDAACFGSEAMDVAEWEAALDNHAIVEKLSRDGKLIAAAAAKHDAGIGYIYSYAVLPEARGNAYGEHLIRKLLHIMAPMTNVVQAHTRIGNKPSQCVLQKCGFKPLAYVPDFYGDCEDGLLWERQNG